MAISAFKHIRLSGYNLTPVNGQGSNLRLGFGNSGIAYYSELTGLSGVLQSFITGANADIDSIFVETGNGLGYTLTGAVNFSGTNGIKFGLAADGKTIIFSGASGNLQAIIDATGSRLDNKINALSGALTGGYLANGYSGWANNTFSTITNLAQTGSTLDNKINALSGALTGGYLATGYSGWASATFISRSIQQVFTTNLTVGSDEFGINYPVIYNQGTNVKVIATLEMPSNSDVMYQLSTKNVGTTGYSGILSDILLEAGAKIHTLASSQ